MGLLAAGAGLVQGLAWTVRSAIEATRINSENIKASGRRELGRVPPDHVLPLAGNTAVFCQDEKALSRLLRARAGALAREGARVAVLTERPWAASLGSPSLPYDPLAGLPPRQAADLIAQAASGFGVDPDCVPYVEAVSSLAAAALGTSSLGALAAFPAERYDDEVAGAVSQGLVTREGAALLRRSLEPSPAVRSLCQFLGKAVSGCSVSAGPDGRSIAEELSRGADVVCLQVTGCHRSELSCIAIRDACRVAGRVHVIVDLPSLAQGVLEEMFDLSVEWTIAAPDLGALCRGELARELLSRCSAFACFKQGAAAAELLSEFLGEFDKVETTFTTDGSSTLGSFGLGFTGAKGTTRAVKRQRIVRADEVSALGDGEYFLYDRTVHGAARCVLLG